MPPRNDLLARIDNYVLILETPGLDAETISEARKRLSELVEEATKRGLRARLPMKNRIKELLK